MSARHNWGVGPIISMVLLLVVGAFAFIVLPNILQPKTTLRIGDGVFNTRVVSNDGDIGRGLSGTAEFDPDQALLIVFPSDKKWDVGTKDIKAKIDIVWLNFDKKVVYVVKNASPDNLGDILFSPRSTARYIIELPAGSVDNKAITLNSTAIFELDEEDKV